MIFNATTRGGARRGWGVILFIFFLMGEGMTWAGVVGGVDHPSRVIPLNVASETSRLVDRVVGSLGEVISCRGVDSLCKVGSVVVLLI